ncbi:MAG: glycosyltransferase [Thermoleophilia bacterium]|nr:glycosyltransferase [Thermoleophilia bacterium]
MRVAIAHEWLTTLGGSERVVEALLELYPDAPVYTAFHSSRNLPEVVKKWDVRTSFVQSLPFLNRIAQKYIPLFPLAFESFDLSGYDLVISSSSACAKGVLTGPGTLHVCYCYTPLRYAWEPHLDARFQFGNPLLKAGNTALLHYLRMWDRLAADRVDEFVAISRNVAAKIGKYYRREATVINPPVSVERFPVKKVARTYFLIVSRLVPYKRLEVAVEAFTRLGLPLKIAGDGPERERLQALAGPNIEFLGFVPDEEVPPLMAGCLALIFPGEEDFGIVPLEAMAAGRPVIGLGRGGLLETIQEGKTGLFFPEPAPASLIDAVSRFSIRDFQPARLSKHAAKFSKERFKKEMADFIDARLRER